MNEIKTSLGFPLTKSGAIWEINLSRLKIFTGLSVLSKIIGENIIELVESHPGDISFLYKINPSINPELIDMKICYIQVYARAGVLNNILSFKEEFHDQLITVFGTLQQRDWRRKIHPKTTAKRSVAAQTDTQPASTALIFPFHHASENEAIDYQFILERVENSHEKEKFFFRLSIETPQKAKLDLNNIPHVAVDDLTTRVFISGSTKIARSINENILNACHAGLKTYSEENRSYSHLFKQLENTKLGRMERINFSWGNNFIKYVLHVNPETSQVFFKKLLLSLEAGSVCKILINGGTVQITVDNVYFSVFLSQLSRVLNVSINSPRRIFHLNDYLKRMPELFFVSNQSDAEYNFSGIRIFLIHHITSEILAFIEALNKLDVDALNVMFVKYGSLVPNAYLEALLENSSESFFSTGLTRKMTEQNQNYYTLASDFNDISSLQELDSEMEKRKLNYFEAMKLAAGHIFLKFCLTAIRDKKKVLLIEDGGYVAPLLNDYALKGLSLADVCKTYLIDSPVENESFDTWLKKMMIGSVEHTKNGFDRLVEIKKEHSKLILPAYSIAVSKNKIQEESSEVANSILSAIESVLHENGLVLSRRKMMVLGANGNIGKWLCRFLINGRMHENNRDLLRVDINPDNTKEFQYKTIDDIPEDLLCSRDLFIGVIGKSIFKKHHLEKIILKGEKSKIFFASGSTKTVEFNDLSNWLNEISGTGKAKLENVPIRIEYDRIKDPQSGIDQGGKVVIQFQRDGIVVKKELFLLSDLSPVNFLYYGVPTEMMDTILAQLLKISLGMIKQYRRGSLPPPGLYAVDKHIDEWGNIQEE